MKQLLSTLLVVVFIFSPLVCMAEENITCIDELKPPQWNDYVPEKYYYPKSYSRGRSISELVVGIVLTDLIITAPIGIPMVVHSSTKLKSIGYRERKQKFNDGLKEADKIENLKERQEFYKQLLSDCRLSEKDKIKYAKKKLKKQAENNNTDAQLEPSL